MTACKKLLAVTILAGGLFVVLALLKAPSSRCRATTLEGTQCSRDAEEGSEFCWQHE